MTTSDFFAIKFLTALESWDDDSLRRLDTVLGDSESLRRLRTILRETLELRASERRPPPTTAHLEHWDPEPDVTSVTADSVLLQTTLLDRSLIPQLRDAVALANSLLGSRIKYDEVKKGGREALISRALREFDKLTSKDRARLATQMSVIRDGGRDGYRELFRRLVRK